MRHQLTRKFTAPNSAPSQDLRKHARARPRVATLFGLALGLLGTGQIAGCLGEGDEGELTVGSTQQALDCGSQAEIMTQGVLGIIGAIPIIGDFVGLPAAAGQLALSLSCTQSLAESRADVAGIAREKIEQNALSEVKSQANLLANTMKGNDDPDVSELNDYALDAAKIERRARDMGFVAVDSWMAASAIRLGALRGRLDLQASTIEAHKDVEKLRAAVLEIQGEAQSLEGTVTQHINGAEKSTDFQQRSWTEGVWNGVNVIENTYTARVRYPNQVVPFESKLVCNNKYGWGKCLETGRQWAQDESQRLLEQKNLEITNAFYSDSYYGFKEGLTEILVALDDWHVRNNLAAGRYTKQSSTDFDGGSARAVDGNRDGRWDVGSITHTANELNPYWEVDLGRTQRVEGVVIYSRTDACCSQVLWDLDVILYDNQHVQVDSSSLTGQNGPSWVYPINGATGGNQARFVRVQLRNKGVARSLQLAEVYVYGMNRARGRLTRQTSTDGQGAPERAVDGQTNGYPGDGGPTQTQVQLGTEYQHWEVELGPTRKIGDVILWNRTDSNMERLKGLRVELVKRTRNKEKAPDGTYPFSDVTVSYAVVANADYAFTWNFGGMEGNVLRVRTQTSGQMVSLSEVEVFQRFDNMRPMGDANALYVSELRPYCLTSQLGAGGGYNNYNGYKQCLSERALSFDASDPAWVSGVRDYCVKSQVAAWGGYNNYQGYKQCLSERSVNFVPDTAWCNGVRNFCEAQWYPWGGKDRCYWERSCDYRY